MPCQTPGGFWPPFSLRCDSGRRDLTLPAIILILAPVLLFAPVATGSDVAEHSLAASVSVALLDFNYDETDQGERLNQERGTLLGGQASIRKHWPAGFIELESDWYGGEADYTGQTQAGMPVATATDETIAHAAALYGRYFMPRQKLTHALLAGLGYRHWQRDIRSTTTAYGLVEKYAWWYAQFGWRASYRINPRSLWSLQAKWLRPFAAAIDIEFSNGFDDASLDLDAENGLQLTLSYGFKMTDDWHLGLSAVFTAWDIGRSREATLRRNGAAVGELFEPASKTRSSALWLTGSYMF